MKKIKRTISFKAKIYKPQNSNSKFLSTFSYISRNGTLHFSPQVRKIKEIQPGKISFTSRNGNREKFLIFSQKKKPQKTFYISGGSLQSLKNKKKSPLRKFIVAIFTSVQNTEITCEAKNKSLRCLYYKLFNYLCFKSCNKINF